MFKYKIEQWENEFTGAPFYVAFVKSRGWFFWGWSELGRVSTLDEAEQLCRRHKKPIAAPRLYSSDVVAAPPAVYPPSDITFHPSFVEVAAKLSSEQKLLIAETARGLVRAISAPPRSVMGKIKSVSAPRRKKSKVKSVSRRRATA